MLKSIALFVTGIMIGINLGAVVFVFQQVSHIVNVLFSLEV